MSQREINSSIIVIDYLPSEETWIAYYLIYQGDGRWEKGEEIAVGTTEGVLRAFIADDHWMFPLMYSEIAKQHRKEPSDG